MVIRPQAGLQNVEHPWPVPLNAGACSFLLLAKIISLPRIKESKIIGLYLAIALMGFHSPVDF